MKRDYRELRQMANEFHDRFSEINYDNSLSLNQKMNLLVEYFKSIAKDWEEILDYLADFTAKFDEKLYNTVYDILNKWLADGVLTDLIRELINEEVIEARTNARGVTYDKLVDRLNDYDKEFAERYTNVKWFGCVGDGITLNTVALNTALTSGAKNFYIPEGEYLIDGEITVPSNVTIIMAHGASLKLKPTNLGSYKMVNVQNVENVNLINFTLIGDKDEHIGIGGEWGHGLNISNAENITMTNLTVKSCWGDNVYVGGSGYDFKSRNIRFDGLTTLINGRRQGLSVINVDGLYINEIYVDTVNGTAPSAGIDFEPNNENETLSNIYIRKVTTKNCDNFGIIFPLRLMSSANPLIYSIVDITIDEFTSIDDKGAILANITRPLAGNIRGNITFGKVTVKNAKTQAVRTENWSERTPQILINKLSSTNHNRVLAESTRESAGVLAYSEISNYGSKRLQIEDLSIVVDNSISKGVYCNSPSGVDVNLKNYYYSSPSSTNINTLKPEEIMYVGGAGNTIIQYAKKYYVLIENIANPNSIFDMEICTKIGTSIRIPNSQQHFGAKLKFQVIVNDSGANSYPNIRLNEGDKLTGGGAGIISDSTKIIRLTGEGATLELESMLGGWRVTNITGTLTVS